MITLVCSCSGQSTKEIFEVPYEKNPKTPAKEYLDSLNLVPFELMNIEIRNSEKGNLVRIHTKDSLLFNGWTIQLFENNEHHYRYVHYSAGLADWQIGYFDNGELDHDFHMKDGENYGSARMWQKGGCFYIDTYFLEGGINDGPAYAWHANCILSRDALYDHDRFVYEVKFDTDGNIVQQKGVIPEKYK